MDKAFNFWCYFYKETIISNAGNTTFDFIANSNTIANLIPRIGLQLLKTKRDFFIVFIKTQNFHCNAITNTYHFTWMSNATPCHISNMKKSINATNIYKYTIIGNIFNDTLDNLTFTQCF